MPTFPQATPRAQSIFLLITAVGLTPIALAYGVVPGRSLPGLFGIDGSAVDTRHIFRAIMGLYLALICFWATGAFVADLRKPALWSVFVFMVGLAAGRVISLIFDGWPGGLLLVYLLLEVTFGCICWWMLRPRTQGAQQAQITR